jgi:hypothetical protein
LALFTNLAHAWTSLFCQGRKQGDEIGQFFAYWATFCFGIFLLFLLRKVFQCKVCSCYFLGFKKGFMWMFWAFKLSFEAVNLAILDLATVLATFSKFWAYFFPIFWSPWLLVTSVKWLLNRHLWPML